MFLATTALEEFWDRDEEIVFLGSWCLSHKRHEGQVLPSPWNDRERFYDACYQTAVYHERMLRRLADYLNGAHGVSLSLRYWRILVGPWLLRYLDPFYDRFGCLRQALERYPDLRTVVTTSYRTPFNFEEAVGLLAGDPYNLQLISQQFASLGYRFPVRSFNDWPVRGRPAAGVKRTLRAAVQAVARLRPGRSVALQGWAATDGWRLALRTRFHAIPCNLERLPARTEPVFDARRNGLASLPATDEFERMFVESLPVNFPVQYMEAFEETRTWILRRTKPAAILSAVWAFGDPFKFLAAEVAEGGGKVDGVQHGGGYGTMRYIPTEVHENQSADSYFAWGWAANNVPHPRMSAFLSVRTREPRADVLFVGTNSPRYLVRFASTPVGSQWEEYFDWQLRFLSAGSAEVHARLTYRPYPEDYGQGVGERITERFPNLRWDKRAPLRKRLESTAIAVIDHPMTSFLETLTANIPTILFWDPRRWEMRPEAEPYFESLRAQGILWDTPEDAAAKLNRVYANPKLWWDQPAVQQASEGFIRRYALSSRNWLDEWAQVVEECLAVPRAEAITER